MSSPNENHYPPVTDEAVKWGFYVTCLGRALAEVAPDLPYGVHPEMYHYDQGPASPESVTLRSPRESGRILPEFAVVLVTDTHAVFESDEMGIVEFDAPTLLFLFPGVWHRYRPVGSSKRWLTSRWLGVSGDIAYRLFQRLSVTPGSAVRSVSRPQVLTKAFDNLIDRFSADAADDPILLSMHAMELMANILESAEATPGTGRPANHSEPGKGAKHDLVNRVLSHIWTGSHRGLTMEQLCHFVGANRRTVERRFREARGHSLLTELNLCRCQRAKHFLEVTDLPVKNVGWLAGFSNPEHMRVTFLQLEKVTPGQYRKRTPRIL